MLVTGCFPWYDATRAHNESERNLLIDKNGLKNDQDQTKTDIWLYVTIDYVLELYCYLCQHEPNNTSQRGGAEESPLVKP